MRAFNTIVVPQGSEYQAVCRGLKKAKAQKVDVVPIPLGTAQLTQVLAKYSELQETSTSVLIMGLCGSLANSHCVGDSVVVQSCEDLNHNLINLDSELTAIIQQKLSIAPVAGLTSDRIITQAREKLIIAQKYAATIVEMEGYEYARELQSKGISVAMLRVISDDLGGDIPDLNQAIDRQGKLKTIPLAIALSKQPIAAIRLIRGSLTGLKALEEITTKLFY